MNEVQSLLTRAADSAGGFVAPTVDSLRRRAQRSARMRTLAAASSVVVLIAALAVALSLRAQSRTTRADRFDPSELPGPSGPAVTAEQLTHYHWETLPRAPITGREGAAVVWTGSQVLVWGGSNRDGTETFGDGAAYDLRRRTWTTLPQSPLSPTDQAAFAAVDGQLVIWGGIDGAGNPVQSGAIFDPSRSIWSMLPPAPIHAGSQAVGFAVGTDFVAITDDGSHIFHAARFDLADRAWTALPDVIVPRGGAWSVSGATAGDTLLIWLSQRLHDPDRVVSLALQNGAWVPTPYDAVRPTKAFWTGRSIVVASQQATCEMCPIPDDEPGAVVDPRTGQTRRIPNYAGSLPGLPYAWTGGALLKVDASDAFPLSPELLGATGAWDPGTGTWTSLPRAPLTDQAGDPIWTGDRLIVLPGTGSRTGVEFRP